MKKIQVTKKISEYDILVEIIPFILDCKNPNIEENKRRITNQTNVLL